MKTKSQKSKQANRTKILKIKKVLRFFLYVPVLALMVFGSLFLTPTVDAAAGINKQINFQGKLVDNNGLNVANGTYSIIFSLYSVSSAGTAIWTETDSVVISNGDGIFQVPLGAVTTLPGSVDFNTDNIYLGIKISTEASEMTPRVRFTAVPYAFNADKIHGLTVTDTTGTLTIAIGKTLTANSSATIAGTDGKTLTLSDSTTLGTNAITLAGTETLTLAAAKSVLFSDAFSTAGTFATTLTSTGITNVTLPTTGTLLTNTAAANQTITSTQATGTVFGITDSTAITAATVGQSITLSGTGAFDQTGLQFNLSNATGANLNDIVGSASSWKISKGGALTVASCTGCGAGGGAAAWSSLTAPTAALAINMYQAVGTSFATTFTYGNATSTTNLFNLTDTASNTGTGYLLNLTTATGSTLKPFHVSATGVEAMTILASGNVGIGTTLPSNVFTIDSGNVTPATPSTYGLALNNSGTNLTLGADASYAYIQSWGGKPLQLNNQGNNTLLNVGGGNVGIGTTAPVTKLSVEIANIGDGFSVVGNTTGSLSPQFSIYDKGTQKGAFGLALGTGHYSNIAQMNDLIFRAVNSTSNGNLLITNQNATGNIIFTTGNSVVTDTAKLTILNGGNIGIGTTAPGAKLDISGGSGLTTGTVLNAIRFLYPHSSGNREYGDVSLY